MDETLWRTLPVREAERTVLADDPDYMAFGPFLALGCGVFCIMEPFFFERMLGIITVLGVHF